MIALQVEQVTKQFGDYTAVNQIDLQVKPGEIYGLLGANGAGKTTTMRMVLGIIYPDSGRILWNGKPFSKDLAHNLGYLPEERGLYPKVRVNEQILYLAELRGMSRKDADQALKKWLDRFGVGEYYHKRVEELSKGNQQKIQFIAAVIHNPGILILDEAFSGLDPVNVELLKQIVLDLRNQGTAILFSTHRMDHVEELCQNITILKKSKTVLQGNLQAIKNSFPKDTVVLSTQAPVAGLQEIHGVSSIETNGREYLIKVSNLQAVQEILHLATRQTEVFRFQIMEPTMNEIFIGSVGDHHE